MGLLLIRRAVAVSPIHSPGGSLRLHLPPIVDPRPGRGHGSTRAMATCSAPERSPSPRNRCGANL